MFCKNARLKSWTYDWDNSNNLQKVTDALTLHTDYVWDGSSCTLATPGYNDGRWHHVAFVVDTTGGRLYVDGVKKAARSWDGIAGPTTTSASLNVGRYPLTATPYLPGSIDDVRLYARPLADERPTDARRGERARRRPAPIASTVAMPASKISPRAVTT